MTRALLIALLVGRSSGRPPRLAQRRRGRRRGQRRLPGPGAPPVTARARQPGHHGACGQIQGGAAGVLEERTDLTPQAVGSRCGEARRSCRSSGRRRSRTPISTRSRSILGAQALRDHTHHGHESHQGGGEAMAWRIRAQLSGARAACCDRRTPGPRGLSPASSATSSGAVLPGVTVEAASPALIEKARTTVTDGSGQYRIVDLRGGAYTVTFTLAGFTTVRREGVQLSGEVIVTVNAEMRVGALAETITVTGEAPDGGRPEHDPAAGDDPRRHRRAADRPQLLEPRLPAARREHLGARRRRRRRRHDVAADDPRQPARRSARHAERREHDDAAGQRRPRHRRAQSRHGVGGDDRHLGPVGRAGPGRHPHQLHPARRRQHLQRVDLRDVRQQRRCRATTSPTTCGRAGCRRPTPSSRPGTSIPALAARSSGIACGSTSPGASTAPTSYPAARSSTSTATTRPTTTVVYDTTQPRVLARRCGRMRQIRLTTQVSPRNKVAFTWDQQTRCSCLAGPGTPSAGVLSATVTPEAGTNFRSPTQRLLHGEWSSPVSNRVLLEAAGGLPRRALGQHAAERRVVRATSSRRRSRPCSSRAR